MHLELRTEVWPFATAFRITSYVFTHAEGLVARLTDGVASGRGEAGGVYYRGETPASMSAQIEAVRRQVRTRPGHAGHDRGGAP